MELFDEPRLVVNTQNDEPHYGSIDQIHMMFMGLKSPMDVQVGKIKDG